MLIRTDISHNHRRVYRLIGHDLYCASTNKLLDQQPREDVRLLQSELRQLGFDVPDREADEGFFGNRTREAVALFQKQNGLETPAWWMRTPPLGSTPRWMRHGSSG